MDEAKRYIREVFEAAQSVDMAAALQLVDWLEKAYADDRCVFIIGNGGSAAAASHFAEDLCKGCLADKVPKRFRVLSLTDNTPFVTAIANDLGYDRVFEFQLRQFARAGDILIAISGSGNSPNVLKAVEYARGNSIRVAGLTGFDGGKLGGMATLSINVPIMDMCKAEAVHCVLTHMVTDMLKDRLAERASGGKRTRPRRGAGKNSAK